ncbi:hypothetical protein LJC00_04185 [Dysgonomonas sp. OttesenSCG-928-M03]|nr:hypothetical protein [Dysgonomonas sp. OttesenSCG-928-M03]
MNCRKRYSKPTAQNCASCEYQEVCKLEQIRNSASKINNIREESSGNFFDKMDEDKSPVGWLYQIVRMIIYLFGIALLAGILQLIFTS